MSSVTAKKLVVDEKADEIKDPHLELVDSPEEEGGSIDLLGTITQMSGSLLTMKEIIQKANFIALNASIEAARTQTQRENFSLVADQVRRQAERTEELAGSLDKEVKELESRALRAMAINFTDVANDIIDKIDRNLFERNCDMQAWAGFREVADCARALKGFTQEQVNQIKQESSSEKEAYMIACAQKIKNLADTYNVYLEVMLVNDKGVVISSAKNPSLVGKDVSRSPSFRAISQTKKIHVTDMYYDDLLEAQTVSYTAPILDEAGELLGMVSNSFNWTYVQDMVDKMPLGSEGDIFIVSESGSILCSRNRHGVLIDHLSWLTAGQKALKGNSGYTIESARNGRLSAWGFCHTFGYNAYQGKKWSAIVANPVNIPDNHFLCEVITRESEGKKQAAPIANKNLERVADKIQQHVKSINSINNETNMLAVNAAIQAGVAGAEGEAFSVIASEIGKLARQSEEFVNNINKLTETLENSVKTTVYNRLGEAAFDTIDKVDRNLYERYCDVQAFASFHEFEKFLGKEADEKEIMDILRKLHDIYEVYHDIMIVDSDGNIRAAAMHREIIGQNQSDRNWFRECISGNVVVTDLYYSKSINDYTVSFAAPIHGKSGRVIGVLTTRFNCEFIFDIMKATIVGNTADVYLINSKGTIIGSPDGEGLLEDSFGHLKAFRMLGKRDHGHTVEADPKHGEGNFAFGYAKTQGYINYKGKGWSVIIRQSLDQTKEEGLHVVGPVESNPRKG